MQSSTPGRDGIIALTVPFTGKATIFDAWSGLRGIQGALRPNAPPRAPSKTNDFSNPLVEKEYEHSLVLGACGGQWTEAVQATLPFMGPTD